MKRKQNVNVQLLPIVMEDNLSISKELGKYLLDISKLIIGGAVITTALDFAADKVDLIVIATIVAVVFALCGLIMFIYKKKSL